MIEAFSCLSLNSLLCSYTKISFILFLLDVEVVSIFFQLGILLYIFLEAFLQNAEYVHPQTGEVWLPGPGGGR